ncbi:hypothetical protein NPIL_99241 [Nephila pilipes]|uniref:Uncharacterized protein n=1 Tax=Nephila pilipes TaxID=299642 RepID=A0A8X6P1F5_NEPPI|nr:hypothetical protein NPIL_99241 [Nephila pilipes]
MITTHQDSLEQYLDSQVPELQEEIPSNVTDAEIPFPGVIKTKCPICTRANETEIAVNCMKSFNLNSNLDPSNLIVLRIFGERIAVCADTDASHTTAGEKLFKFLL